MLVPERVIEALLRFEAIPPFQEPVLTFTSKKSLLVGLLVTDFPSIFAIELFKPRLVFEVVFCELLGKIIAPIVMFFIYFSII